MGWFSPVFESRRGLAEVDYWLKDALVGSTASVTGVAVSETSALGAAAVFACVRVLAESVGQLPLKVFRRLPNGGRVVDDQHPLYPLLHELPNPELTAYEFRVALQGHLALWGNAYAEVERDGFGRITGLWPLRPDRMTVTRNEQKQRVWLYRLPDGSDVKWTWAQPTRQPAPILHLRGFGPDGFLGYSPLQLLKEPIGLTLATEEYGARLFSNSATPRGLLSSPNRLSPEAATRLKNSWEAAHRGLDRAHRVAVLEEGISWQAIGLNAEDAQFLQTRKFQLGEIARIFRIPPHFIGDLERATFSNIEQQGLEFVQHTLMPWLVCWEQACARDLLSVKGFATHQIRFVVNGLLRGDIASRYQAYAVGRQWGWLSADDIRELEDMNPLPSGQGDVYLTPLNMTSAETPPAPPAAPTGSANGQEEDRPDDDASDESDESDT